ncbi:iron chelate uptake ABC transporter family permease subunit [Microbacterium sp.]|uniref:FecCD family ABC transporter permease n=1 Tax=Microbacterium sp. TaxID=51671 RepID=UPI0025D7E808|nr:iron chelate uptake ABC transporter family permease subunit [Microbacterium sp.]
MTAVAVPRAPLADVEAVASGRRRRAREQMRTVSVLSGLTIALFGLSLTIGSTFYSPADVVRVILGEQVPAASFTVGTLRLPRAVTALLTGVGFGIAGVVFQTLLRNPLASPDIIGISSGASAAAVFGIVVLSLSEGAVSALALTGALATALVIYVLSHRGGFAGTRLILTGIGIAAMLNAMVTFVLSRAAAWDLQAAMRWISGSLNGANWTTVVTLALGCAVLAPLLISQSRALSILHLGDDSAAALGLRVDRTRIILIICAVGLLAFATAAAGPIAFVAFMAGPIAVRLVGSGSALVLSAGLVGAVLVMASDLIGQFAFDTRYPVGVITGVLGGPYLIFLLIRTNRAGGAI